MGAHCVATRDRRRRNSHHNALHRNINIHLACENKVQLLICLLSLSLSSLSLSLSLCPNVLLAHDRQSLFAVLRPKRIGN
jgi:hypothetical protein